VAFWKRDTSQRIETVKAQLVGAGGAQSNVLPPEASQQNKFSEAGALDPPLPFERICGLFYISSILRQNIDSYITNIDSFGWVPEPSIELNARTVKELLTVQNDGEVPSDETVDSTLTKWRAEAAVELARMRNFFDFVNPEKTFTELRREARLDHELIGNSGFEVLRDGEGRPNVISFVPFCTMRVLPLDPAAPVVREEVPHKTDPVTLDTVVVSKRYRTYVQFQDNIMVFFKEYGDTRLASAMTGVFYENEEQMKKEEPEAVAATEFWHRKIPAPNEVYGMPRWIGTLLCVLGNRLSEEVNFLYFDNKSVPPLAILVSGGRIAGDSISKIESFVENRIKGEANFHRILILEAESAEGKDSKNAGRAQIKLVPLTEAQQQDALFQKYDARNADKVGASFRLPGILRGESRNLNRATAAIAKALAEEQVFQPERDAFDADINRRILPALGIRFWEFKTKGPKQRDPQVLATMLTQLVAQGVIMPDEAREIAKDIFGREFERRKGELFEQPLRVSVATMRAREGGPPTTEEDQESNRKRKKKPDEDDEYKGDDDDAKEIARRLLRVRNEMDALEMEEEVVRVDRSEFNSWFEGENGK
jgi:PBSX family phage portal protein